MSEETKALEKIEAPEEQQKIVETKFDIGTIETVRRTVFPGSTDDELRIYLYKCLVVGAHPLSGKVIPVKFRDNSEEGAGNKRLSFISTIDLGRSIANETGEYDGQDEAVFTGTETVKDDNGHEIEVPAEARVNVYRKGISRPFVGVARWTEYYPGLKRGHMWRKMPHGQLSKCAEMAALRKGFPEKLNLMYAAQELDQAGLRDDTSGGKPAVTPTKTYPKIEKPQPESAPTKGPNKPPAANAETKEYSMNGAKVKFLRHSTDSACYGCGKMAPKTGMMLTALGLCYDCVKNNVAPKAVAQPAQQAPSLTFVQVAESLLLAAGFTDMKSLEAALFAEFSYATLGDVPAAEQNAIIDWMQTRSEKK